MARIHDAWTLEQFADHYAETLAKPANAWGQHCSPLFGQSHYIMIAACCRFPTDSVNAAFSKAVKERGI